MLLSYALLAFFSLCYCLTASGLWAPLGRDASGGAAGTGALALVCALLVLLFAASLRRRSGGPPAPLP